MILFLFFLACSTGIAPQDPWKDCPEEKQCLSGDTVSNEAKSCCATDQVCYVKEIIEGGSCIPKEEAAKLRKEKEEKESKVSAKKESPDPWKDCPKERQCTSNTDGAEKKSCCAADESCTTPDSATSGVCTKLKEVKPVQTSEPRFEGYNMQGKKASLPKHCAMCKRMNTEEEKSFLKACYAKGGKTHSCGCLTILCNKKVH